MRGLGFMAGDSSGGRSRGRLVFSILLISAFVAGTTLGPGFVSAANTAISNVFVTNSSIAVTGTVGVTGSVGINGAVQMGATTVVIAAGTGTAGTGRGGDLTVIAPTDLRAYRQVTLYLEAFSVPLGSQDCRALIANAIPPTSFDWTAIAEFTAPLGGIANVQTFDPAPPVLAVSCFNNADTTADYRWLLIGRPN